MELIKTDIESDLTEAETAETTSQGEHTQLLADLKTTKESLDEVVGDLDDDIADAETEVGVQDGDRTANQGDLTASLGTLDSLASGCNYIRQHFEGRQKARKSEIDGLVSAQKVLNKANEASR